MGTAGSKRKSVRSDAVSSVAAKVRAARAFGEYLAQTHPENHNRSDHLLSDAFLVQHSDSADGDCTHNNNNHLRPVSEPGLSKSQPSLPQARPPERRLSLEPVYTISGERGMLGRRGSKDSLELEVLQRGGDEQHQGRGHHHGNHHHGTAGHHHRHHHHHHGQPQPLQSSVSAHDIGSEDCSLACEACAGSNTHSQRSLDLESSSRDAEEDTSGGWFPKDNVFSFQTATTTMQAISNFRKHLRMVGSRRMKAQSGELQTSCSTLEDGVCGTLDWEDELELERMACEGEDFIPPKIMLISSKVPKAEYVPNIIRRDDPSIIPILYDHEHATFDDILEEIDKKLTAYRKGCRIWRMLLFCQGGPGHLYLLKNKVATFAKVEKEEDMSQFWRRLSRFMSKMNPEPNLIHIMGCYVLGNPNGEKLFQKLKNLMRPYSVTFESPLELSAQGKEMIETYFDFRLFRLWKTRQHSKMLDYDDLLR